MIIDKDFPVSLINCASSIQTPYRQPMQIPVIMATKFWFLRRTNEDLASKLALKGGVDPTIQKQIDDNITKINQLSRGNASQPANPALKIADRKQELIKEKLDLQSSIASTDRQY